MTIVRISLIDKLEAHLRVEDRHSLEGAYVFNGSRKCSTCHNARLRIKRQVKVTA